MFQTERTAQFSEDDRYTLKKKALKRYREVAFMPFPSLLQIHWDFGHRHSNLSAVQAINYKLLQISIEGLLGERGSSDLTLICVSSIPTEIVRRCCWNLPFIPYTTLMHSATDVYWDHLLLRNHAGGNLLLLYTSESGGRLAACNRASRNFAPLTT